MGTASPDPVSMPAINSSAAAQPAPLSDSPLYGAGTRHAGADPDLPFAGERPFAERVARNDESQLRGSPHYR